MSLAVLADHMASRGRGPDSMLIHMSPNEVAGLQALAMSHGGSLTINPDTGLPEAGFLDKLLPTILGAGLTFMGVPPNVSAMIVGGIQTVRTGDLGKGIQAGLGAYGGANLTSSMTAAGESAIGSQAAGQSYLDSSVPSVLEGAGAGLSADMAYNLGQAGIDTAGAEASRLAQQAATSAVEAASPYEKLSRGFDSTVNQFKNSPMEALKSNAKNLGYAFGPAILAEMSAKEKMPQTVTKPGMITPYSFFGGQYVAGNPYQATPTRSAEGGLMGLAADGMAGYGDGDDVPKRNGMAMGGMFDFAQRSEPVVRMAEGGIPGYAGGALVSDKQIFDYFATPTPGRTDADIARDMQTYNVTAADIARATGTGARQGEYETRFVQAINKPDTSAAEFQAMTADVGLQNQALANAMQNAGMSQAAQYAATHNLTDTKAPQTDFYNQFGYTVGALPGDQGGLEGLYANINYSAQGLQNQINAGKLTVGQAQNLALAEMDRVGVNQRDIKAATGKDFGDLFTPKKDDKKPPITCGPGYRLNAAGTACEPIPIVEQFQCPSGYHYDPVTRSCVPNSSATQNTTGTVTTPTDISTADRSTLPVGVSGAGVTTINPNGTITTRPDIPGIPEGGFTGMTSLRDAYTKGGGDLGVNKNLFVPKTLAEMNERYKLTGGSAQAMDYLTGKTKYSPIPYTEDGQIAKSYAESVMKLPRASSSKMYIFKDGKFVPNPDYAIPTYDKEGKKSYNLTNKDVATFMDTKPSTEAFYTWATTNNLSPEQIALASGRPINEISKLFTGAKDLVGEDGKIDQTKVDEKTAKDIETNWDEAAYLAANPSVAEELRTGKSVSGQPVQFTSGYEHWLRYGKDQGWKPTVKKAAAGGLAAMARGGAAQFDLGDYSDGGRLLRGPGDGVSDSIPATIGNKRPARLADGEFVVPARIVSELGNGSTEAGARKLYAMMDRIQAARRGTVGKGRVAKNSRAEKYLPA